MSKKKSREKEKEKSAGKEDDHEVKLEKKGCQFRDDALESVKAAGDTYDNAHVAGLMDSSRNLENESCGGAAGNFDSSMNYYNNDESQRELDADKKSTAPKVNASEDASASDKGLERKMSKKKSAEKKSKHKDHQDDELD